MHDRRRGEGSGARAIALAALIAVLTAGSWLVWQRMRHPLPAETPAQPPQGSASSAARPEETLAGTFYLPADGLLTAHSLTVRKHHEPQLQARDAVQTLLSAQRTAMVPVLKDLGLRSLYLDDSGTAYVDLSLASPKAVRASSWDELLAIYAMVNTVMKNVPEIRQVRLLVDGRESQTMAGHLDLSRSFVVRMDLVRNP